MLSKKFDFATEAVSHKEQSNKNIARNAKH